MDLLRTHIKKIRKKIFTKENQSQKVSCNVIFIQLLFNSNLRLGGVTKCCTELNQFLSLHLKMKYSKKENVFFLIWYSKFFKSSAVYFCRHTTCNTQIESLLSSLHQIPHYIIFLNSCFPTAVKFYTVVVTTIFILTLISLGSQKNITLERWTI